MICNEIDPDLTIFRNQCMNKIKHELKMSFRPEIKLYSAFPEKGNFSETVLHPDELYHSVYINT